MPVSVTFRPTGDGAYSNNWTQSAGPNKFSMVDEVVEDGDTTYIERDNSTQAYQLFTCTFNAMRGMAPISAVEIYSHAKQIGGADANYQHAIRLGSTNSELPVPGHTLGSYATVHDDFIADRPGGGTWLHSDFDINLQWGIRRSSTNGDTLRCTQVYAVVTGEFTSGFSSVVADALLPLIGLAGILHREIVQLLSRVDIRVTRDELIRIREILVYNPKALYARDLQ